MKLRISIAVAALLATVTAPTGAMAQSWARYDGYGSGWNDGYDEGQGDGYDLGWGDGWSDHRDQQRQTAYYSHDYDYDDDYAYERRPAYHACKRGSGTGGLIVGALAGSLLGREVTRRDRTAGAIIGGGVGALAGRALDRGQSGC